MNKIVAIPAALGATIILIAASSTTTVFQALFSNNTTSLDCTGASSSAEAAEYTAEQLNNAAVIVAVGKQLHVPEQGQLVALVTAMQESTLTNLDHGDRDSLGLFQQRPSQGWGSPAQIMNPTYAATQFYQHLLATPRWQNMSVNDAAQAVQRSGIPDAYAQHEPAARTILAAVRSAHCTTTTSDVAGTGDCNAIQAPNAATLAAINYACGQRGLPYVWGGNGAELTELPNGQTQVTGGFDCSGLTKAAYAVAKIQIPRTAQTQYDAGPRVPPGQPILPGDLVFFGSSTGAVTHVGIAISAESMIDAPHEGAVVRLERIWSSNLVGTTRPAVTHVG